MENEQKLQELRAEMLQKESDYEAMTQQMAAYKAKVDELEALLSQERKAREDLQENQEKLAKMNKKLTEVCSRCESIIVIRYKTAFAEWPGLNSGV